MCSGVLTSPAARGLSEGLVDTQQALISEECGGITANIRNPSSEVSLEDYQ